MRTNKAQPVCCALPGIYIVTKRLKIMRIALITPRLKDKWNKHTFNNTESLSTGYLAAFIEQNGHEADVINANSMNLDNNQVISVLKNNKIKYSCIGISCISQKSYEPSRDLAMKIRKEFPDCHIVIGGLYPTIEYANILNDIPINAVILGEGEYPLLSIINTICCGENNFENIRGVAFIKDGHVNVTAPERICDLNKLPFPKRENIDFSKIIDKRMYMIAGKGCYGNCAYCSLRSIDTYKTRHYRDASNVVDEMELLMGKHGVNKFYFHDDIFYDQSINSKNWLYEFHNEIINRELELEYRIYLRPNDVRDDDIKLLKKSGLKQVYIGIESGVQRILDEMQKKTSVEDGKNAINILLNNGVEVDIGFITLVPTMTFEELKENYSYLFNLGYYKVANLNDRLNIYTGCEYENILRKKNLLYPKKTFWERQEYRFEDNRVGKYHDSLQLIKSYLKTSMNFQDEIKRDLLDHDDMDGIKELDNEYLALWTRIVKELLKELDTSNEIIINKYYSLIDTYLNNLKQRNAKLLAGK